MRSDSNSNWPFARTLIVGYLAVALVLVFAGWYAVARVESEANRITDRYEQASDSLLRIDSLANDGAQEVFAYLVSDLEEELEDFRVAARSISTEFTRFASIARLSELGNEERLAQLTIIQDRWLAYVNVTEGLVAQYQNGIEITQENFLPVEEALDEFFDHFNELSAEIDALFEIETRQKDEIIRNSEVLIVTVSAVGVLSLLIISVLLSRMIKTYVGQIRSGSQGLQLRSTALDSVGVAVCFADAEEHNLIYVNDAFVQTTGYSREEVLGKNCRFLQGPETDRKDIADIRKALRDGLPITKLLRNHRKNGEPFWNSMSISPVRDPEGKLTHFVGALDDRTEQLLMESKLLQTQKMDAIGKLTGGIAHDFNNILAVIMGNQELLDDEITEPEQKKLVRNSVEATQRGAELARNMLSFARRAPLQPSIVDLNQLVRNLENWIGRTLPSTIDVETSLLAGLWPIKVDASSAESGLLNLILNARDAMPNGGKLTIETTNVRIDEDYLSLRDENIGPGRYVMLAISDTGEGIASDKLATVFEPFYTSKPAGSGTGLGLSMVEGFMKQSDGTIRVYSELGVGTTFKLFFAAADKSELPVKTPRSPVTASGEGNDATILLVDDAAEVLETIRAALEKSGFRILTAISGDAAREVFESNSDIDLLLTDIVMPGELQGTSLAKVLRAQNPDLPVVFMSGYASEATVHGNGLRPEDIRLMKPVQRDSLLRAINKALGR